MHTKAWGVLFLLISISGMPGCDRAGKSETDGMVVVKESTSLALDTTKSVSPSPASQFQSGRQISEADKQYLTLMIPDYSEIVFHHESGKETLNYTAALQQYFIERNCSINGNEIIKDKRGTSRKKRFYIQHVGDNRFVVSIYDQYGNEAHP